MAASQYNSSNKAGKKSETHSQPFYLQLTQKLFGNESLDKEIKDSIIKD